MITSSRSVALLLGLLIGACGGGRASVPAPVTPAAKPFAMRIYVFVVLHRGPAWTAESTPETKQLSAGHMANIEAMARAKQLVLAGPFETPKEDAKGLAGIFIFDATKVEDVAPLLANDPAIAAGRLVPQFTLWYGPVGLTYDGADQVTKPAP